MPITTEAWFGMGTAVAIPPYYRASAAASDAGEAFELYALSDPLFLAGRSGEAVYRWAWLALSHSMGAAIRVTPVVDGTSAPVTVGSGTLEVVASTINLPQQMGTPAQRRLAVYPVPLVRRLVRDGAEVARFFVRGAGLQLLIETTGELGTGDLVLESVEVEAEALRRAAYEAVTT